MPNEGENTGGQNNSGAGDQSQNVHSNNQPTAPTIEVPHSLKGTMDFLMSGKTAQTFEKELDEFAVKGGNGQNNNQDPADPNKPVVDPNKKDGAAAASGTPNPEKKEGEEKGGKKEIEIDTPLFGKQKLGADKQG